MIEGQMKVLHGVVIAHVTLTKIIQRRILVQWRGIDVNHKCVMMIVGDEMIEMTMEMM